MRPRKKNVLKQDRPGQVSDFLNAGYYSKIRNESEGRLKCCFIFTSSHLPHTSPGSGWSPHLRRATEHCKEEEEEEGSFHIQDQQVSLVQRKFPRWPEG